MPTLTIAAIVTAGAIAYLIVGFSQIENLTKGNSDEGQAWLFLSFLISAVVAVLGSAFFVLLGIVKLVKFMWAA